MGWRHLGRFHVQESRDFDEEKSDNSVKLVVDLLSLNAALEVDARREQDAAELMETPIHFTLLAGNTSTDHHTKLIQTTLTFNTKTLPLNNQNYRFTNKLMNEYTDSYSTYERDCTGHNVRQQMGISVNISGTYMPSQ